MIALVAAEDVEKRAAIDVARADQMAQVPTAARLVLHFFLAEGVGRVGERSAEDDGMGPHFGMKLPSAFTARVRKIVLTTPGGRTRSQKLAVAPSRPLLDTLRSRRPMRTFAG